MPWDYSLISYLFVGLPLLAIILMRKRSNAEKKSQISPQNAYQIALDEVQNNEVQEGLWAEAYAHSQDEESRKKYYVRERAKQLTPEKKKTSFRLSLFYFLVFLGVVYIGAEIVEQIGNPMLYRAYGEGMIGGMSVLIVLAPIYIIKKIIDWIKK